MIQIRPAEFKLPQHGPRRFLFADPLSQRTAGHNTGKLRNAWEWFEDCWRNHFRGAALDGGAWTKEKCRRHVVRSSSAQSVAPFELRESAAFHGVA